MASQTPPVNPYAAPRAALDVAAEETQPVRLFAVSGRIGRVRYIAYLMGLYVLFAILTFAAAALAGPLATVLWVAYVALAFMLTIQRCHDFNTTGWLALVSLLPLVNLIFWFIPGTDGRNRWGPPTPANSTLSVVLVWILPLLALVGIVAAIALPAYQQYVKRAQQVEQRR